MKHQRQEQIKKQNDLISKIMLDKIREFKNLV